MVELLAPQQAGEGLALDPPHVGVGNACLQHRVEGIGLPPAAFDLGIEIGEHRLLAVPE